MDLCGNLDYSMLKTDSVTDFKNRFQDNYQFNRIILTDAIVLHSCRRVIDMFLFSRLLPYATTQRNFGIKVEQNFQEFSKKYMEQFLQFLHAKTATSSPEQFKRKMVFSPSCYSEKMRWGRGWPKHLYVLFIVKA